MQSPRRVIHVDEGTAGRNMLPRLVEECLLGFRPVQVIVRLDECCDRVRVCDCEQQVDAEPVYEIFREFRAVYRDDRVEPAPGEGMREAERRLQMLEALPLSGRGRVKRLRPRFFECPIGCSSLRSL